MTTLLKRIDPEPKLDILSVVTVALLTVTLLKSVASTVIDPFLAFGKTCFKTLTDFSGSLS